MPKAIQYNPNSVIYFEGDIEDKVYILQKGSIVMTFTDIETGSRVNEYIKQGEFFGFSCLPRLNLKALPCLIPEL